MLWFSVQYDKIWKHFHVVSTNTGYFFPRMSFYTVILTAFRTSTHTAEASFCSRSFFFSIAQIVSVQKEGQLNRMNSIFPEQYWFYSINRLLNVNAFPIYVFDDTEKERLWYAGFYLFVLQDRHNAAVILHLMTDIVSSKVIILKSSE